MRQTFLCCLNGFQRPPIVDLAPLYGAERLAGTSSGSRQWTNTKLGKSASKAEASNDGCAIRTDLELVG